MATYPIQWHEKCLHNLRESQKRKEDQLLKLAAEVRKGRGGIDQYQFQIDCAKREDKEEFDTDKYRILQPNKKKHSKQ